MQPTAAAKSGGDASGLKPSTTVEGCTDKTQPSSQPGRKEQGQGEGERGPTAAPKPAPSTTPSVCGKTDIAAAPKQGAGDAAAPSRRSAAESEAKGSARRESASAKAAVASPPSPLCATSFKSASAQPLSQTSSLAQKRGSSSLVGETEAVDDDDIFSPSILMHINKQASTLVVTASASATAVTRCLAVELFKMEEQLSNRSGDWIKLEDENAALKQRIEALEAEVAKLRLGHSELDRFMFDEEDEDEEFVTPRVMVAQADPGPQHVQHVYEAEEEGAVLESAAVNAIRRFSVEPAPPSPVNMSRRTKPEKEPLDKRKKGFFGSRKTVA